eukprot:evm.model.NODE_5962_length_8616_cov_28.606546.2
MKVTTLATSSCASTSTSSASQLVAKAAMGLEEAMETLARTLLERAGMATPAAAEWARPLLIGGIVAFLFVIVAVSRRLVHALCGDRPSRTAEGKNSPYHKQQQPEQARPTLASTKEDPSHYQPGSHNSSLYGGGSRPDNVGILATEIYFPSTYVRQTLLERAHGVSQGKFTSGLGQAGMAFVGDREDINSIALTVVENLLSKYDIPREKVGRLEVGTETLVDRAKSTKTVLMSLFEASGNTDIEGTTVVNACYGGTAALLNALAWVESSGWDGRYAIVVCADIAMYADGPAKPTGGCGAVALLVGPDAPLVIDSKLRATHASNTWDFFKPKFASEYPEVDGKMSKECYLRALDDCYLRFAGKQEEAFGKPFCADEIDYFCFHHPYNKLVQKAFGRLFYMDTRRGKLKKTVGEEWGSLEPWAATPLEETYDDRDLESLLRGLSHDRFSKRVGPSCLVSMQVGNTYTASVYMNVVCLIALKAQELVGKRMLVYSFGSGALATMFQITGRQPSSSVNSGRFTLCKMASTINLMDRLLERETVTPEELSEAIRIREKNVNRGGFVPQYSVSSLFPGTFYLEEVRPDFTRVYLRKLPTAPRIKGLFYPVHGSSKVIMVEKVLTTIKDGLGQQVLSPFVRELELKEEDEGQHHEEIISSCTSSNNSSPSLTSTPSSSPKREMIGVTHLSSGGSCAFTFRHVSEHQQQPSYSSPSYPLVVRPPSTQGHSFSMPHSLSLKSPTLLELTHEETLKAMLKASITTAAASPIRHHGGAPLVISGVAAGLPGKDRDVFSGTNLADLVNGTNFITNLSEETKLSLIEKNVVQLKKNPDGTTTKLAVDSEKKVMKLGAQLGRFDLMAYGVSKAMVATMDTVVQVAIAAGLEALKDAGIVKGEGKDLSSWQLPEHMRDSTGVVYATSFPALEAAVSEVMRFLHSKEKSLTQSKALLASVKNQLVANCGGDWEHVGPEDRAAYEQLEVSLKARLEDPDAEYEFDRKFLFRILVLGNAQLAQIVGARGPNMQTNAACAGTTQAIAIGQDMIQQGRCERLVVIASDNASGDVLIPWLGSGFRALGAASISERVEDAALPFDKRRKGLVLGAGAIGMVLETEAAVARRYAEKTGLLKLSMTGRSTSSTSTNSTSSTSTGSSGGNLGASVVMSKEHIEAFGLALRIRLIDTQYSNSAYHGAALDQHHIAGELARFLGSLEKKFGITRQQIAEEGVYLSHETSTHASDASSCAANEIFALRTCFGDAGMEKLIVLNTKGYTGHPMGVSFEDVAAVQILRSGIMPPVANLDEKHTDPYLGKINLGKGGRFNARYALRFAAGFGSQVAFALYGQLGGGGQEEGEGGYYAGVHAGAHAGAQP